LVHKTITCEAPKKKKISFFAWFYFYLDILFKKQSGIKNIWQPQFGNHNYFSFQLNIANLWCEHCVVFYSICRWSEEEKHQKHTISSHYYTAKWYVLSDIQGVNKSLLLWKVNINEMYIHHALWLLLWILIDGGEVSNC